MKDKLKAVIHVNHRVPIIRTIETTSDVRNSHDTTTPVEGPAKAPSVKTNLNIPIGEVVIDANYEKEVSPDFALPSSYVKHQRKIGDEADASIEYVVDREDEVWLKGLGTLGLPRDLQRLLSVEALEAVINVLERYTGLSKNPIPLFNAHTIVADKLSAVWNDAALTRLLPEVYRYWLDKRNRLQKPLCRRYWPQTTSLHTDPHQVFRTRDKERYKLRKQQKRNDIESFRKMQQLRKDFARAQILMKLIQEREKLREADFLMQREIFEQQLRDSSKPNDAGAGAASSHSHTTAYPSHPLSPSLEAPSSSGTRDSNTDSGPAAVAAGTGTGTGPGSEGQERGNSNGRHSTDAAQTIPTGDTTAKIQSVGHKAAGDDSNNSSRNGTGNGNGEQNTKAPFRYKLMFPDLVYPPPPPEKPARKHLGNGIGHGPGSRGEKLGTAGAGAGAGGGGGGGGGDKSTTGGAGSSKTSKKLNGANGSKENSSKQDNGNAATDDPLQGPPLKKRKKKKDRQDWDANANAPAGTITAGGAGTGTGAAADDVVDEHEDLRARLDGPRGFCQPAWPSFMTRVPYRDEEPNLIPRSWAQYKSDLELRSVPKPDRFYSDPIRAAPINHSINFFPYSVISVDDDGNTTEEYFNNAKLYDPPINAADVATNGSSNSSCSSSSGSSSSRNIDLGESAMVRSHAQLYDALSGELPVKYRARCRIGRGNRLIVDRIPIYAAEGEEDEDRHTYFDKDDTYGATAAALLTKKGIYDTIAPGTSAGTARLASNAVPPGNFATSDFTERYSGRGQPTHSRHSMRMGSYSTHGRTFPDITYIQPTSLRPVYPASAFKYHFGATTAGATTAGAGAAVPHRTPGLGSSRGRGGGGPGRGRGALKAGNKKGATTAAAALPSQHPSSSSARGSSTLRVENVAQLPHSARSPALASFIGDRRQPQNGLVQQGAFSFSAVGDVEAVAANTSGEQSSSSSSGSSGALLPTVPSADGNGVGSNTTQREQESKVGAGVRGTGSAAERDPGLEGLDPQQEEEEDSVGCSSAASTIHAGSAAGGSECSSAESARNGGSAVGVGTGTSARVAGAGAGAGSMPGIWVPEPLPEVGLSNLQLLMYSEQHRRRRKGSSGRGGTKQRVAAASATTTTSAAAEGSLSSKARALLALAQNSDIAATIPKIPVIYPPPAPDISAEKAQRLKAILEMEDSEDERLVLNDYIRGADIERAAKGKPPLSRVPYAIKHQLNL